ncbi:hypothetical protein [Salinibacterium sp. NK8237]|uniref:hypothetical protein n=1 Tax=Salinibacterium sp. NK8237 TaxID=2792038 RepID=UPI0018CECB1A|nr:hypothetical protein [Salinibacterium sp. NK8237]MBH0129511.1 hypothetical protein [Salinibacterium sp. NK8237]
MKMFLAFCGVFIGSLFVWGIANEFVRLGIWPTALIDACDRSLVCIAATVGTNAIPIWTAALWLLGVVALLVVGMKKGASSGAKKTVAQLNAPVKTPEDQRIALAVGRTLMVSTIGFSTLLLVVPAAAGLVAAATWSQADISRCTADELCAISLLPSNALPVWVAFAWATVILVSLLICWKPARWWVAPGRGKKRPRVFPYTSPFWIRYHAIALVLVAARCSLGIVWRDNSVTALEYLWVVVLGATIIALSTLSIGLRGLQGPAEWPSRKTP